MIVTLYVTEDKTMIYSETENPECVICVHAKSGTVSGNVTCDIKGTVPEDFCCKRFKYDIFKRKVHPKKTFLQKNFSKEDFEI